jgi:arabinogalactan endo-1,4-beta-galactosidase
VVDYDYIGISYYPYWSEQSLAELGATILRARREFGAEVILVETGYVWSLGRTDAEQDERAAQMLEPGYPASIDGQKRFLVDLAGTVRHNGGAGMFFWEPAAVATLCNGRRGHEGERWDNSLFDYRRGNELLPGAEYLSIFSR